MWDICRDSTTGTFPTISQEFDDEGFMFYKHQLSAELITTELVMLSKHLTLNCSLLLLASIFPNIRVYTNDLVPHIRWPKYWSFSIFASNEYSGLISLRIDWFDLLAVQGVLESLLQYHNLKACLTFLMVQLSHLYITTGKTIALTRWTFVAK